MIRNRFLGLFEFYQTGSVFSTIFTEWQFSFAHLTLILLDFSTSFTISFVLLYLLFKKEKSQSNVSGA
jgi:hypothetical protein